MSISSASGTSYSYFLSQLQLADSGQTTGTNANGGTGNRFQAPTGVSLLGAISDALSQIGVSIQSGGATTSTTDASSTSSSSTQSAAKAMGAFLQHLIVALQSQKVNGGNNSSGSGSSSSSDVSGSPASLESSVRSLIQQLTSSSTSSSSATSSASESGSSVDTSLRSSFRNLMSLRGGNSNSATLQDFLQALSTNLQNHVSAGNVVNTCA